jgi:D-sedoheptulose 7-phosphate isomerase
MAGASTEDRRRARVEAIFGDAIRAHERFARLDPAPVLAAARLLDTSLGAGGSVLVFGNGGSAADAQHFAADLVGRFERDRQALKAVALSTDPSVLTAIANDEGFGRVFARQVEALGRRGDVAVGISTSGASANVLAGLETARRGGLATVALTGRDGGPIGRAADVHINVPEAATPRIQEVHRTVLHALCALMEDALDEPDA